MPARSRTGTRRTSSLPRATIGALVIAILLVLPGCEIWWSVDPHFRTATISSEGQDVYVLSYSAASNALEVTAPAWQNTHTNDRGVSWPAGQRTSLDGESCARWRFESHQTRVQTNIQEGAALRVRRNGDGSLDAITVTRNVWGGVWWVFNVNLWHVVDTSQPELTNLIGVDLGAVFASNVTLPWRMCARTRGSKLSFVVWPDGTPKPTYGNTTYGRTMTLPLRFVYGGNFGWYVGHLHRGQSVTYDRLSSDPR